MKTNTKRLRRLTTSSFVAATLLAAAPASAGLLDLDLGLTLCVVLGGDTDGDGICGGNALT